MSLNVLAFISQQYSTNGRAYASVASVRLSVCDVYRVAQKSKPQNFVHIFVKYWPILKIFFTGTFYGKFVIVHGY